MILKQLVPCAIFQNHSSPWLTFPDSTSFPNNSNYCYCHFVRKLFLGDPNWRALPITLLCISQDRLGYAVITIGSNFYWLYTTKIIIFLIHINFSDKIQATFQLSHLLLGGSALQSPSVSWHFHVNMCFSDCHIKGRKSWRFK